MSDLDILFNPGKFFPIKRRVFASLSEPYSVRHQYAQYYSQAMIAEWCGANFQHEKALFHQLRIERKLAHHRYYLQLAGKFEFAPIAPIEVHEPGYYLLHGFRKHRWPL